MPGLLSLLGLLTIACSPAAHAVSARDVAHNALDIGEPFTILPVEQGPALLGSCSPTPEPGQPWYPSAFWQPDTTLVREVEARLPALLDSVLPRVASHNGYPDTASAGAYRRQYVGFEREGGRVVYVHGFHEGLLRLFRETGVALRWRTDLMAVCDAGSAVFGVVWDPQSETFGRLEFSQSFAGLVEYR